MAKNHDLVVDQQQQPAPRMIQGHGANSLAGEFPLGQHLSGFQIPETKKPVGTERDQASAGFGKPQFLHRLTLCPPGGAAASKSRCNNSLLI